MPFFLLAVGIILIVAAYRNKQGDLYDVVKEDFFGPNNFIVWSLAIALIGAIGSVKSLKPISDAFLVLIILVIIVKNYRDNQDILTMFVNEVRGGTESSPTSGITHQLDGIINSTGKSALKAAGKLLKGIGLK